ncbi:MAG: 4-hydroxybenzoate octaprenyltransferase [Pseudomonadota bacterium]
MTIKATANEITRRVREHPHGERMAQYALLVRADKPIGIYLLLWPCLWALWIAAEGIPDIWVLIVFVVGTFLMRSAGCAINDYADRNIDAHIARTNDRPLATGAISPKEALAVFAVLSLIAFALVLTMNAFTIYLSFAGMGLAVLYPFSKRFTHLPQVFLGAAFAWAVPMAFAAQTGSVNKTTWLLYIVTVLWALAYDTLYAMVDREDDAKIGVKSTAILFGDSDVFIVAMTEAVVFLGLLLVGAQMDLGAIFYVAWTVAALYTTFLVFLAADRHPVHCFRAFLNHHHVGWIVFVGIALHYAID